MRCSARKEIQTKPKVLTELRRQTSEFRQLKFEKQSERERYRERERQGGKERELWKSSADLLGSLAEYHPANVEPEAL